MILRYAPFWIGLLFCIGWIPVFWGSRLVVGYLGIVSLCLLLSALYVGVKIERRILVVLSLIAILTVPVWVSSIGFLPVSAFLLFVVVACVVFGVRIRQPLFVLSHALVAVIVVFSVVSPLAQPSGPTEVVVPAEPTGDMDWDAVRLPEGSTLIFEGWSGRNGTQEAVVLAVLSGVQSGTYRYDTIILNKGTVVCQDENEQRVAVRDTDSQTVRISVACSVQPIDEISVEFTNGTHSIVSSLDVPGPGGPSSG
ncbi:MAG: hypothetical protein ACMXYM_04745 [Candidatus Woesearchaeota archaeon]